MQLLFWSKFFKHLSFKILCSVSFLFDQSYLSNFAVQTRYEVDFAVETALELQILSFFFVVCIIQGYFDEEETIYVIVCVNNKIQLQIIYIFGDHFLILDFFGAKERKVKHNQMMFGLCLLIPFRQVILLTHLINILSYI